MLSHETAGEEFKKQFALPTETEVTTIDRIGDDITKNISYTLQFIDSARFIIKAHYQILPITFLKVLKEFIELNVDSEMMIKNLKLVELNKSISTVFFFNIQILKII